MRTARSKEKIQNVCLIAVFIAAFVAVIFLGLRQAALREEESGTSVFLTEKVPFGQASVADSTESDDSVFVASGGTKFHTYADCSALKRSGSVRSMTREEAMSEGRNLCSICKNRAE